MMMNQWKKRVWEITEVAKPGDWRSKFFDIFILSLIIINVLLIVIGTVKSINDVYGVWIDAFGTFSLVIFATEYLLRVWACTEDSRYTHPLRGRLRFMLTPLMLLDLLVLLPFFLPFLFSEQAGFLRSFRLLRIFRMAHLSRYVSSLRLLGNVVRNSKEELFLTTILLIMVLLISSSLLFYLENPYNPEGFPDIPSTMWWGIITLTTIGYGDLVPMTAGGKVLTSFIAVLGIGMFALPAGILGSGFVEELQKSRSQRDKMKRSNSPKASANYCPHCGKALDK